MARRSTMMGDATPVRTASPRTTIVGGRPPESEPAGPPVPTGIQSLLRLAAVDPRFRDELVERRGAVAAAAGLSLTPSETAILGSIPATQLREMAEKMPAPDPDRRELLRQSAATAVVLLGGAALAEVSGACCVDEDSPLRPDHNLMQEEGGAAPDEPEWPEPPTDPGTPGEPPTPPPEEPPQRPDHDVMYESGGAAPDEPPPLDDPPTSIGGATADEPPTPPPEEPTPEPPPLTRGHSHDVPSQRRGKTRD